MSYHQIVEPHHRETYADNVQMVAQQMNNPLRNAVTITTDVSGEAHSMADLIGRKKYQRSEDYSRRNPDNPSPRSRRWLVRPEGIEDGEYITKQEMFDRTQDQTSILIKNQVTTIEMGVFDSILGVSEMEDGTFKVNGSGIMGRVTEGRRPGSATALPTANYIPAGGEGMNETKLRAATEAMEIAEFGLETDHEVYGLVTPRQKTDLINLALATKTSLNPFDVENIREGKPGRLLGVNWIFTNRLPKDNDGNRLCPIWTKSSIVAGFWQDIQASMWNDTNAKNLPYIFADAYVDCGRVEDGGTRIIRCVES